MRKLPIAAALLALGCAPLVAPQAAADTFVANFEDTWTQNISTIIDHQPLVSCPHATKLFINGLGLTAPVPFDRLKATLTSPEGVSAMRYYVLGESYAQEEPAIQKLDKYFVDYGTARYARYMGSTCGLVASYDPAKATAWLDEARAAGLAAAKKLDSSMKLPVGPSVVNPPSGHDATSNKRGQTVVDDHGDAHHKDAGLSSAASGGGLIVTIIAAILAALTWFAPTITVTIAP